MIKKLRNKHNWSQEQLAQLSGLSLRTIQRVEAGNKASLETLKALASVFEINISTLTEEITMIDRESNDWQNEPWLLKFFLLGIKRRNHMVILEYMLITVGILSWVLFESIEITTPVAFLGAYVNTKLISYVDEKAYW